MTRSLAAAIETARRSVDATRAAHEVAVAHLRELEALAGGGEAPARPVPADKPKRMLGLDEAADIAGLHRETVQKYAPLIGFGAKVGGRWRIDPDLFEDWFRPLKAPRGNR